MAPNKLLIESNVNVKKNPGSATNAYWHIVQAHGASVLKAIMMRKSSDVCNTVLMFQLSKSVIVSFVNFDEVPKSAYMSIHHRKPLQHLECFAQFALSGFFKKQKVLTSLGRQFGKPGPINNSLEGLFNRLMSFVFNSVSITTLPTSEDRYWNLVTVLGENECLSVFPCRESAQFYGDKEFYFRDGLFAASIFSGIPILDFVMIEPTATKDYTTIDIIQFLPPSVSTDGVTDASSYAIWRTKNCQLIYDFTQHVEAAHKFHVTKLESLYASCYAEHQNGFTEANATVDKDIRRNRSYVDYRESQLQKNLKFM